MKYLKNFNLFKESVVINDRYARHIIDGDNFDLPKHLKFPEIEDLDMYLQLIEDDGYEYEVEEFLVKESSSKDTPVSYTKFEFGIHDICDYKFIKVIAVELQEFYDLNKIDFLEEFKRKYFKSDKFDLKIDVVKRILKIKLIPKEVIDVKNIIKKFNEDVEKFLKDNKDILTGDISSFGFSTVITNCNVSNLDLMKDKLEEFLNSYDYYIGVVLNQNSRMTFTLSMDLAESE